MSNSGSSALVRRVHIDTDPGLDDLLALALAWASPELRVEAITTVAGNASLEHVTDNARRFLAFAGLDLPLGKGAARPLSLETTDAISVHGEDGRGGIALPEVPPGALPDAREVLRHSLLERRVDRIVALGPLTNIAALVDEDASLFGKTEIVWMGGSLCDGNVTPVAEFNCYADPLAAATVLGSGLNVRVIGLDVTNCVVLRDRDLPEQPFGVGPRAATLTAILDAMMEVERPVHGERCAILHDPSAIASLIHLDLFRYEDKVIDTQVVEGLERGRMSQLDSLGASVRYAVEVDHPRLIQLFLSRLSAWAGTAE
ncbi:MAG: hypothetical protein GY725_17390 [bacterium]|nr:hypothetical protein [bacterium]